VRRQGRGGHGCLAACYVERWRPSTALLAGRASHPVRCMCGGRPRLLRRRAGRSVCAYSPGAAMRYCSSLRALASWSGFGCMVDGSGLPACKKTCGGLWREEMGLHGSVTYGSCICELLVSVHQSANISVYQSALSIRGSALRAWPCVRCTTGASGSCQPVIICPCTVPGCHTKHCFKERLPGTLLCVNATCVGL